MTSNMTVNDEDLSIKYLDVANNFPQIVQLIHHSKSPWFIRKPFLLNTSHTASETHKTKPWAMLDDTILQHSVHFKTIKSNEQLYF